jgi:hypothetical protein
MILLYGQSRVHQNYNFGFIRAFGCFLAASKDKQLEHGYGFLF